METAGKHVCPQTLSLTGRFGEPQYGVRRGSAVRSPFSATHHAWNITSLPRPTFHVGSFRFPCNIYSLYAAY